MTRKGIILAGGSGTRLAPLTDAVSKQLLPVYNKPMIYYPLSMLMLAGISEILVISTPRDLPCFKQLLGDGNQWGLSFQYMAQEEPRGLPDAFNIGKKFLAGSPVCLVLGDNIFYGNELGNIFSKLASQVEGAAILGYPVRDPERYGVIEVDSSEKPLSLEEKPTKPRSNYAIPGLYFFDSTVVEKTSKLQLSARGELEITDLIRIYLNEQRLSVEILGRGIAWFDTGTHQSLLQASNFVEAIEERQGTMIACPEEIAFRRGWIDREQLQNQAKAKSKNGYGNYLFSLLQETA